MKAILQKKSSGFYMSVATLVCTLLGMLFFRMLTSGSFESSEQPTTVMTAAAIAAVLCLITAVKDIFKIPSLGAFVMATVTFFAFLSGRVSYVAFFLSGDVMGSGMSIYFILSALCFFCGMILSIMAMCLKQEK